MSYLNLRSNETEKINALQQEIFYDSVSKFANMIEKCRVLIYDRGKTHSLKRYNALHKLELYLKNNTNTDKRLNDKLNIIFSGEKDIKIINNYICIYNGNTELFEICLGFLEKNKKIKIYFSGDEPMGNKEGDLSLEVQILLDERKTHKIFEFGIIIVNIQVETTLDNKFAAFPIIEGIYTL